MNDSNSRLAQLAAVIATGALGVFSALPAAAQDYPTREIHAVCSYAAGSGADILVRYYSDKLAKLVKPVIVETARAPGLIGTEYAAKPGRTVTPF
jgi:tripartite-type tricarboxylate transporter receptor subunit TctC